MADTAGYFLSLSKGPSFGTEFSLACPYTLLAHYDELEWAEGCGVSRNLIRFSVGTEGSEELIKRFTEAFAAI
jgi:cystathionine gamma-synthase